MDTVGGTSTESPALSEDQHDAERERGPAPPYRESVSVDQDSGVAFDDLTDAGHGDSVRASSTATSAAAAAVAADSSAEPDRPSGQRGSIGTLPTGWYVDAYEPVAHAPSALSGTAALGLSSAAMSGAIGAVL